MNSKLKRNYRLKKSISKLKLKGGYNLKSSNSFLGNL